MPWFFGDWVRYSRMASAEPIRLINFYPQLHDRTSTTPFDAHYFYMGGWAARRIIAGKPANHVDVGGQAMFVSQLSAAVPVTFIDIRPLGVDFSGLTEVAGSILELPFPDGSIRSLSCLHVAEHIGLGRYGDPLDPLGTVKAAAELSRVLAPGGSLFFALPVGRPRLCFNAHRVHSPGQIIGMFPGLRLEEFSAVDDEERFWEKIDPARMESSDYGCGMFWFRKPQ